jgi:hypothetical protein
MFSRTCASVSKLLERSCPWKIIGILLFKEVLAFYWSPLLGIQEPTAGLSAEPLCSSRLRLKCGGTRAETRFRLSAKRTSPFKWAGASVQSTTGSSRGVHISGCNAAYTIFRGSVKSTGYPLHSPVSLSLPLQCVTVCHHISTGLYTTHTQFFFCQDQLCYILFSNLTLAVAHGCLHLEFSLEIVYLLLISPVRALFPPTLFSFIVLPHCLNKRNVDYDIILLERKCWWNEN